MFPLSLSSLTSVAMEFSFLKPKKNLGLYAIDTISEVKTLSLEAKSFLIHLATCTSWDNELNEGLIYLYSKIDELETNIEYFQDQLSFNKNHSMIQNPLLLSKLEKKINFAAKELETIEEALEWEEKRIDQLQKDLKPKFKLTLIKKG